MSNHITYKSSLSKQELNIISHKDLVPIKDWIHHNVKECGINNNKLSKFWTYTNNYLTYISNNPHAKEISQRSNGLKDKLLKKVFPSNQVGEVSKGNEDLSIMDKLNNTRVIFEYKSLDNHSEMMTKEDLNRKGLAEVIDYYLAERCGYYIRNGHLQYISNTPDYHNTRAITGIVTNGYDWFVIPNGSLRDYFNGSLMKKYQRWCEQVHLESQDDTNPYFQEEYISPAIDNALEKGMKIGYFNLVDAAKGTSYTKQNSDKYSKDQKRFYQFLSPQELLQENFKVQPNQLNKKFYRELLYIMGLEISSNGRRIQRIGTGLKKKDAEAKRYHYRASLLEQIYSLNNKIPFDDAINIVMSFIDRILFLKLFEAQLQSFNPSLKNELSFMSYSPKHIKNFKDINDLFFKVMAVRRSERKPLSLQKKYNNVPYLNSSLFKLTNIEKHYDIDPSRFNSSLKLPIYHRSTLTKYQSNSITKLPVLEYLLDFLSHYKFDANSHSVLTGRGSERGKVINAAILGMVFEKINGYKQGSFFTPDYIAAHMAKKAIDASLSRKLQNNGLILKHKYNNNLVMNVKFNMSYYLGNKKCTRQQYLNKLKKVFDDFRLVDPAVGSAHFLVASLNYLLKLKFDLGIFTNDYNTALNLTVNYNLQYDNNGQLWLTNQFDKQFEYHRNILLSSKIQSAFFNAKQNIIEHNLYGVDINISSVGIAKLRLWIELLKDAYYDQNGQMVTMPNLETNIKVGNSLITHLIGHHKMMPLDGFKHMNVSIINLKGMIKNYRSESSHFKESQELSKIKDAIKRMSLHSNQMFLQHQNGQTNLVIHNNKEAYNEQILNNIDQYTGTLRNHPISGDVLKLDFELINIIERNIRKVIGYNTFEWAFEFPELLSIKGKDVRFKGFDLVITNPPYIYDSFDLNQHQFFKENYPLSSYQINSFELFIELSLALTKHGYVSMIIPNTFLVTKQCRNIRDYLLKHTNNVSILNSKDRIFPEASVDNCIILFGKGKPNKVKAYLLKNRSFKYINELPANDLMDKDEINVEAFNHPKIISDIMNTIIKHGKPISYYKHKNHKIYKINNYGIVKDGVKLYEGGKGIPSQPKNSKDSQGHKIGHEFDDFKAKNPYIKQLDSPNSVFNKRFLGKGSLYRYGYKWNHQYIEYGKNLAARRNENIFKGPKLLISRILNNQSPYTLKVAYSTKEYICAQGIEIIHPKNINPLTMLAILNSKVLGFYIIARLGLLQRKTFPQIRLYHIRGLLIPKLTKYDETKLKNYAKILMNTDKREEHPNINLRINDIVMKAFGLNNKQQKYLINFKI